LEVTGGTFYRTYDPIQLSEGAVTFTIETAADGGPIESDPASVSSFRLDKYLVTVGRFRQFVNAWNGGVGYVPAAGSGKQTHLNNGKGLTAFESEGSYEPGWVAADDSNIAPTNTNLNCETGFTTWTDSVGSNENLPINCVNWYEAYAFCIWDGGFLPSEAEWEYSAAGGSQQRDYPWGSAAPGGACPGTGCEYAIYNCDYPNDSGNCAGVSNIAPVGTATLGAGLWGQLDLAGEVSEWNLDRWASGYVNPCIDCADLYQPSEGWVYTGASFGDPAYYLLPPQLFDYGAAGGRLSFLGLRCARGPQ
jgi:formylglycine-generating enzyme required for sulfatase activity